MSPEVVTISPDGATASPKHPDCLAAFKEWGKDGVHIWASVFVALVSSQVREKGGKERREEGKESRRDG